MHRSEFPGEIYISFRAFNFYSILSFILCFSLPVKAGVLVTETSQCASNSQPLHTGFHIAEFKNSSSSQSCHLWFFSNILLITFRLINAVYWPLSVCPGAICYAILVQRVFCYSFGSLPGTMTDAGKKAGASGVSLQGLNPYCKLQAAAQFEFRKTCWITGRFGAACFCHTVRDCFCWILKEKLSCSQWLATGYWALMSGSSFFNTLEL